MTTALKVLAGVIVGGLLGYGYQRLVGCSSGGCPITSNPTIATIYGAIIGLSIALMP